VYGLGDALEISRVDGRLRRRRDGVTGEEGVEGIMDFDQRDEVDVTGSLFLTQLLQSIDSASDSQIHL
jgi:hypothetical protein